ncbi:hypothetical protein E4U40_001502 [Claviceps sp. LM458 group G5]|nr:hypothetical protein E4U40_001502 [Claviceps sp. LM458 group G5]
MDSSPKRKCSGCKQTLSATDFPRKEIRRKETPAAVNPGESTDNPSVRALTCERCTARIRNRRAAERAARAAETSTTHLVPLPPSRPCSGCGKLRPVTDFSLKNPLGDAHGERYRVCAPCKVKRDNRRTPKRNIDQVGQQDGEPPPARQQRLSTVPTEAAGATGIEETPAIDLASLPSRASVPSRWCSGCKRSLSLCDFPTKDNRILLTCVRCKVRQQNRRPPRRQTAPPQIGQENVAGPENIAPRPVRRARQGRARTTANRAAAERRRTAAVEETLAAAVRTAEGIARQASERADPAMAAEAEVEAARRAMRASQEARRAARASEETRRAAVLQESMAAAAAAQAKVEAARLAARDWRLPVYRPRFGPISTVQSRS